MADSNERAERRRRRKKAKSQADLIRALDHELRRRILRLLEDSDVALSPVKMATQLDEPLSNVSYHVNILHALNAAAKVGETQVRGALEHFYVTIIKDNKPVQALLEETREADRASGSSRR